MSSSVSPPESSGTTKSRVATGVSRFAGIMLAVVAVFEILQGIAAIANDSVFVRASTYTYALDVTAWGWIHLIIGLLGLAVGLAIIGERTVGYLGGIGVAVLGAVANFAFLPYYPVWSMLVIGFNVLVIWALCKQLGADRVDEDYYARHEMMAGHSARSGVGESWPIPTTPPTMPH